MAGGHESNPELDQRSREVFGSSPVVEGFEGAEGWLHPAERESLLMVAADVRGAPVLDLGIGTGRTTSLLCLLSDDYVGVDYSPEMVSVARRRHPGVDIRLGDARHLDGVADGHFALGLFSNNGIDAIDRSGRAQILAECHRVLRPGGILIVTTLNLDGPSFGETPWQVRRPHRPLAAHPKPILQSLARSAAHPQRRLDAWRNWSRVRSHVSSGDGWAYGPLAAHEFRLVVHFTTLGRARRDVEDAGFRVITILDDAGGGALDGERAVGTDAFYVVARR